MLVFKKKNHIKNLANFTPKKIAKLVKFTAEKQKFPEISQFVLN